MRAGGGTISVKKGGKLIRCSLSFSEGKIDRFRLTGDFFLFPEESIELLERSLTGCSLSEYGAVVRKFFDGVDSIGISAENVIELIGLDIAQQEGSCQR